MALWSWLVGAMPAGATDTVVLALDPGPGGAGVWQTMGSPAAGVAITAADAAGPAGVRLDFTLPAPFGWAGAVVLAAPDAWGQTPAPAFDLSAAARLSFFARGQQGGERLRVKIATAGDQPYGDSSPLPFDSGWLTLASDWQRFELPLNGARLGRVVTPFVVIANRQHNPSGTPTVWLDRIRFEARPTADPPPGKTAPR